MNVKYISLVNLIMDKLVVKELIQRDLTTAKLVYELNELLNNPTRRAVLQKDYQDLNTILSAGGHASSTAATSIVRFLKERNS